MTEHKIKLKKGYRKVLALYAAYNNTFVFRGVKGQRQDCIVHVNADGKILQ